MSPIAKIPGVVDVNDGIVLAGDAVNIVVDRDKAALEGIDPDAVTQEADAVLAPKGIDAGFDDNA